MGWRAFGTILLLFAYVLAFNGSAFGSPVQGSGAVYESSVTFNVKEQRSVTRHSLAVPWTLAASSRDEPSALGGRFYIDLEQAGGDALTWTAALDGARGPLAAAFFFGRPHRSSADPFRLVHSSAYRPGSPAALLEWKGQWTGSLHYVADVPLRRAPGPLLAARVIPRPVPWAFNWVEYGSERVRHRFIAVDHRTTWANQPLDWGLAWLQGMEAEDGRGPGLIVQRPVKDGAAFVRSGWRLGDHGGWFRLHVTGPDFRSYAADDYPFARGRGGVEGRWQWRLQRGRLLSAYVHRLQSLSSAPTGVMPAPVDYEAEISYSSMPRGQWGWRLFADGKTKDGRPHSGSLEATFVDGGRRFQLVTGVVWRGGSMAGRHRVQWEDGHWRLRLLLDGHFRGWRLETRLSDWAGWDIALIFKMRRSTSTDPKDDWLHVELVRHLSSAGRVWVRYMEPDLGRIDVGWTRPLTVAAGVTVAF